MGYARCQMPDTGEIMIHDRNGSMDSERSSILLLSVIVTTLLWNRTIALQWQCDVLELKII